MIVQFFVCDYCGNQNEVHRSKMTSDYLDNRLEKSIPVSEKDEEEEEAREMLYFSVNMNSYPVYEVGRNAHRNEISDLGFCSKSCFIDFLQKNLDENGKLKLSK